MRPYSFLPALLLMLVPIALKGGIVFDVPQVTVPCEVGQTVVKATLSFRVETTDPMLKITNIKTGCDCTTATADAESYKSGAIGKIHLVFTVGERTGFQRKTVTIKTSDGKEAVAFFQTTIPPTLTLKPAFLIWGKNSPQTTQQILATLASSAKIISLQETPTDKFNTKLIPPDKAGSQDYRINITPRSTAIPFTARIHIKTTLPNGKIEDFTIVASVK